MGKLVIHISAACFHAVFTAIWCMFPQELSLSWVGLNILYNVVAMLIQIRKVEQLITT